ncbi:MAG: hypothetical protein EOP38_22190, partial [Rubrivivax sp.]
MQFSENAEFACFSAGGRVTFPIRNSLIGRVMPILAKSPSGTVTGLWGSAFIKLPNGKLKALQVGDEVKAGEQIITTQDGIVQITNPKGKVAEVKPAAPLTDLDRTIAGLEEGDEATAAGAGGGGGADGGLQEGLRVDRVSESVGQQSFEYGTTDNDFVVDIGGTPFQLFATAEVSPPAPLPAVGSVSSPSATEGGNLDFTVTLTNPSDTATVVTVNVGSGTGTVGTDTGTIQVSTDGGTTFVPVNVAPDGSFTVTVPPNSPTDALVVRVPTTVDNITEGPENIKVTAGTGENTTPAEGTGTINDGNGLPQLSINDVTVNEAAGVAVYTVTLSNPSSSAVTVSYGTQNGTATAGSDFTATTGTLTFAPGETTKTITVPITNDNVFEGVENYTVVLSGASGNAQIADGSGLGGINDQGGPTTPPPGPNTPPTTPDDDRPVVSTVSSPSTTEGGNLNFQVTLSKQSTTPTTVTLKLTGDTATLATDTGTVKVSTNGGTSFTDATVNPDGTITVNVPANAPTNALVVQVPTVADTISEGAETVKLTGSTPQNTTPAEGTGTINDSNGLPQLSINDVEVNEAAGVAVFTVTLSNPSSSAVTVSYGTQNGSATAGSDFTNTAGSLTFAPGETTKTISVPITNDNVFEGVENYTVVLSGASANAQIADGSGLGGINDQGGPTTPPPGPNTPPTTPDDDTPIVGVNDIQVHEGVENAVFTLTLSNPSTTDIVIRVKTSNGTATAGADYTAVDTEVTIKAGELSVDVPVPINNDTVFEGPEKFQLEITPVSGNVKVGKDVAEAIITDYGNPDDPTDPTMDNDLPSVVSVSSPETVEGGNLDFKVTLSNPSKLPVPVLLTLGVPDEDTATVGTDTGQVQVSFDGGATFVNVVVDADGAFQVEVPPSDTPGQLIVRVPAVVDAQAEGPETVQLLAATDRNTENQFGTGTINDRPLLSINDVEVNEAAGVAVFTVTLSNPSSAAVTVSYGTQNGTATAGNDFTNAAGTLTFAPGETTKTITVPITNDSVFEGVENFTVVLSGASGSAQIADASGLGGINDQGGPATPPPTPNTSPTTPDDDRPVVSEISSPTTLEGGNLNFQVTLSNQSTTPTTVTLKLTGATATLGTDTGTVKVSTDGGANFADAVVNPDGTITVVVPKDAPTNALVVQVPTVKDAISEGSETVKLTGSTQQNTTSAEGTGTINDDNG